ncbi:MAG: SUMF1/EgtB/PvdO family nonheme iron enzyme [Flavobacteriales bacterium]|nr:SUMF1/EgtB/PvdO family nonheme iron enzyme [Flavobacteriales bacterium]
MKNVLGIIFLISVNNLWAQKEHFKAYTDTIIFSKTPVKISAYYDSYLTPRNAIMGNHRDSLKRVYFRQDFPVQLTRNEPVGIECSLVDTFYIKGYLGDPMLEEMNAQFTFFNPLNELTKSNFWEVPKSVLYYQNPNRVSVDLEQFQLTSSELSSIEINEYFRPFYFQNNEITNLWYRQFVYYVRDSIARRILADELDPLKWSLPTYNANGELLDEAFWNLNWEPKLDFGKYEENEQFPYLATMFLSESDRFYGRLELDTRELVYKYVNEKNETILINIYPDTLCWINHFQYENVESITNFYFWHPGYDNFPVNGVNFHQATAFCDWMTKQINKHLQSKSSRYRIKYQLPSIIQWDYVRQKVMAENKAIIEPRFNWETNLMIKERDKYPINDGKDTVYKYSDYLLNEGRIYRLNLINSPPSTDVEFAPFSNALIENVAYYLLSNKESSLKKKSKPSIKNIVNMGASLSEWLQESYDENWKFIYFKRMELLVKTSGIDSDIQALREDYFNSFNHPNGRLVIGTNWFDFRDEYAEGKSFECMDAKVFANPDSSFATVGFRMVGFVYVVN